MHDFYLSREDAQTISFLRKLVSRGIKSVFIYLDAMILKSEKSQGMDLILQSYNGFKGNIFLLIDSRYKAVEKLHELSHMLNRDLAIRTSAVYTKKVQTLEGFQKFQTMSAFTLVITKSTWSTLTPHHYPPLMYKISSQLYLSQTR